MEEDFENGKDLGMDQYEVRSFLGWFHHITLVLLVLAVLTVICAKERVDATAAGEETHQTSPSPIPLTVPQVRRLLGRLLFPLARSTTSVPAWSWWRRCQQARASASHAKHRLNSCELFAVPMLPKHFLVSRSDRLTSLCEQTHANLYPWSPCKFLGSVLVVLTISLEI